MEMDNPEPHVEGSKDCRWMRVRITPEALRAIATRARCDVTIKTDDDGYVMPTFTPWDREAHLWLTLKPGVEVRA